MKNNSGKRILNIQIRRLEDADPDTSWLGEFGDKAETDFAINHRERIGGNSSDYPYFNPGTVETFDPAAEWHGGSRKKWLECMKSNAEADYARMMKLENGEFSFMGIRASAEIQLEQRGTIQTLTSGGLWGIESDSDKSYFAEVEAEELGELKKELRAAGFSARAVAMACKSVVQAD